MEIKVIMPHMGESVVEGEILNWLNKPGDKVRENEPLLEISTDKINVEVPAPASGTLKEVIAEAGTTVEVGQTIAVIVEEDQETPPVEEPKPKSKDTKQPAKKPPKHEEAREPVEVGKLSVVASPAVRRMAHQTGVDLADVEASGHMGRITKEDLNAHIERTEKSLKPPSGAGEGRPGEDEELVPLTRMRRAIAEHMTRSKREAAQVTTVSEVDMTIAAELRDKLRDKYADKDVKLTYMAFILNAVARALKEFPWLNAQWTGEGILLKRRVNLGVAVAVKDGLVVPVIRDADRLSLFDLAREIQTVAEKTRRGKVGPSDMGGGTFTVTNPGVFGAVISTPIIHYPQAAILAIGRIADLPVVIDGEIVVRKRMNLSLSYDHRIVDGATAVRFLQRICEILEAADCEDASD